MRKATTFHPDDRQSSNDDQTDRSENLRQDTDDAVPRETGASADAAAGEARRAGAETPEETVEQLRARIEKLEDSLLREKAECQNIRRRAAMEQAQAIRFANAQLLKSLLEVLDDFDRAVSAADESENLAAVIEGVRLVHNKLHATLGRCGLEVIDALGKEFDPGVHDAILHQPTADLPPGMVIEEVAKGYKLHDQLLRPARVVVSKAKEEESGQEAPSQGG